MNPASALALIFLLSISVVSAHEEAAPLSLPDPVAFLYYTALISGLAVAASLVFKISRKEKKIVFALIAAPVALSTAYLAGHTVYLNIASESGGPVHWHADYEVWVCGEKLDLAAPKGIENRVGSAAFHEHNDNRMHVEGVLNKLSSASLETFFEAVGGELTEDEMSYPTDSGTVAVKKNGLCDGYPASLQAFVYKTVGKKYHQEKLEEFPHYVLSHYSDVPPGDCIIIEFSGEKNATNKMCETYLVAKNKGDIVVG